MTTTPSARQPAQGRLAPTPSGWMHLGNVRTALVAWLAVRSRNGTLYMRMEDADAGRCRPHFAADILSGLAWLGLEWDGDVVWQSQRNSIYAAALARLDTYYCSCTRKELRVGIDLPDGVEPVYAGTCRTRQIGEHGNAVRWRVPAVTIEVEDGICGELRQHLPSEVGDFILRRRDGVYAYQYAVVVDDAAMGINQVIRGQDLLGSTPRQVALLQALGAPVPTYHHVPLLLSACGEKLSKRGRAVALAEVRAAGVSPRRVLAWLGQSLGFVPAEVGEIALDELLRGFELASLSRAPTILTHDPEF